MGNITFLLAAYGAAGVTLILIAGGWVKIRNYFRDKKQATLAQHQAEIEAKAKELLEQQQAEAKQV